MPSPFPTTRRSVVLALSADDAHERARAFDTLVQLYWKPLYKYARVSIRREPEDVEDLVQGFFARVLENEALRSYDGKRASFRTFLRLLFDRYAANEFKAAGRIKRGGDRTRVEVEDAEAELQKDASPQLSPEEYFQREWVRNLFAIAVARLRESANPIQFAVFEAYDVTGGVSYRELSTRFGIPETSVTNHLSAMRRRFRELVLDTLREATATDEEFRTEARALLGVEA
jgi:RNA polymerase sigma-70 factor (ECF subfamily)